MVQSVRSICRCCSNQCGITVAVENGRAVRVQGDREDPLYAGYSCVKGRAQPDLLTHPDRLLRSYERRAQGFQPVDVAVALDDIAARLLAIRDEFGPQSIAAYAGTMQTAVPGADVALNELLALLGTELRFDPNTIDKGGKQIAEACLGKWMAPSQGFDSPDVVMLIGANPLITYTGFPAGNPKRWLRDGLGRGMKLVVIDPRRSEVAAKAALHLRPRPGHDPDILAAIIHVVLAEGRHDHGFVAENVSGLEDLRRCVRAFTPERVAAEADVDAHDIVAAGRMFASARRGYAFAGTGPSMAATGSLSEYLVLVLDTICGHWLREGEPVSAAPTLLPVPEYKAQAMPPVPWSIGRRFHSRGLTRTTAGLPTTAFADEVLTPGPDRIRALLVLGGNPALAFPDQLKTLRALGALDLLVTVDPWWSATAKLADYVIAPTMPLEVPSASVFLDSITSRATGYGLGVSYASYTPAVVEVPEGSDLIEDWEVFRGLHLRIEALCSDRGDALRPRPPLLDAPDTDALLDLLTRGSRVPLDVVRREPGGHLYPAPDVVVRPKDPGWTGRLDVGNAEMLQDLGERAGSDHAVPAGAERFPFRLLCRRMNHVYNSSYNVRATNNGRPYNPAFMHPDDLARLALQPGDLVTISSALSAIAAVVEADIRARRGTVGMSFGFGGPPDLDKDVRTVGSSPSRLVDLDGVYDRYIGQPQMSNLPVSVTRLVDG